MVQTEIHIASADVLGKVDKTSIAMFKNIIYEFLNDSKHDNSCSTLAGYGNRESGTCIYSTAATYFEKGRLPHFPNQNF